jgi:hypothetical protein
MSAQLTPGSLDGSLLLELLHYAGWRLQIRKARTVSIRAVRDGVEVHANGSTLPEAAAQTFARAMRSRRHPTAG